jgi:hypothetical protein
VQRHDLEIEDYVDQQANSSVDYAYSFQSNQLSLLKQNKHEEK